MALLWLEGFEGLGTTLGASIQTYLVRRYPVVTSTTIYLAAGRISGYSVRANGAGALRTGALTTCDTVVFGCALKPHTTSLNSQKFADFMYGSTVNIRCEINPDYGEIDVYQGTSTLLGSTVGANLSYRWSYIEVKVKCHDTTGTVEVRVDGVTKLSLTGVDTKPGANAYYDRLQINLAYQDYFIDDIYFLDTTGAVNNDFLGPQHIVGMFPNADTATVEWTPSTGTDHYALVDETVDNDDTDYVESADVGEIDLWEYPDLAGITTVNGIQIGTTAKLSDASAFNLITRVHSGSTDSDNAGVAATSSYVGYCRVLETDPDTASLWTPSGVNAMQVGVKVG